jgi:hypothetical protein
MAIQSQDVEHQPNAPGQQGNRSPQQPSDRPTPQSGQNEGKRPDQKRPGEMGNKGSGAN